MAGIFNPSKVIAVGLNYRDHAKELKMSIPDYPILFLKPSTSVIGHNEPIILPRQTSELNYEGELGIVIGKPAKNVSVEDASQYISGYTCANDVTARDLQRADGQWTRAKSFDTFCPLGPVIVSEVAATNLKIVTRVNGETKQNSSTSDRTCEKIAYSSVVESQLCF